MSILENSVVKIISNLSVPEYSKPWTSRKLGKGIGTGFCINITRKGTKKRIITNAHVVENATSIVIIKQGSSMPYKARVEHVIVECDLAILVLHETVSASIVKSFWEKTPPLRLGPMPSKMAKVSIYGYPLGGNNISITKGVISRTEILPYNFIADGIAIQIDAAINPGNSGGPAIDSQGNVIGVAFAGIDMVGIQNMGYIIPTLFIRYILRYIKKHGTFKGLSYLGLEVQNLENENLRKFAMLDAMHTGVLINDIAPGSSADGKLKVGDIMTKINGYNVDFDGTMKLHDIVMDFKLGMLGKPEDDNTEKTKSAKKDLEEKINKDNILLSEDEVSAYSSLIGLTLPGSTVTVSVIREGKSRDVKIIMKTREFLVPISYYQIPPLYYILGGFVFVPLTRMFIIDMLKKGRDVGGLIGFAEGGFPLEKGDQLIVVSTVLSSALTHGYEVNNYILESINGKTARNMSELKKIGDSILKSPATKKSGFVVITYMDSPEIHVLDTKEVKKYSKKIIEENIGLIPHTNV